MKLKKTHIAAALAAVAVLAGTQAAFATTTLSVDGATSPVGSVAFSGATTTLLDFETNYGVPTTCWPADLEGNLLRGTSGPVGTKIGAITEADFGDCDFTRLGWKTRIYKRSGTPEWTIHLAELPVKGAASAKVELRNVKLQMHGGGPPWTCAANLYGTVKASITAGPNSKLVINTPALAGGYSNTNPLVVDALDTSLDETNTTNDVTCAGEFWDSDLTSLRGTFELDRDVNF